MEEYLKAQRERHNTLHQPEEMQISLHDIVLIKDDEMHRGEWNIGMVDKLYRGKDGVIRAVGLKTSKIVYRASDSILVPTRVIL